MLVPVRLETVTTSFCSAPVISGGVHTIDVSVDQLVVLQLTLVIMMVTV
jgi:hypothetical protein